MATKVYLRSFAGGLDPASWAGVLPYPRPSIGVGTGDAANGLTTAQPTQASPGTTIQIATAASGTDILAHEFISQPFASAVTISGTVTFNVWGVENSMSANAGARFQLFRVDCTTGQATSFLASSRGVEFGTSMAVQNWTGAPTSTAFNKGDLLLVQLRLANVGTMGGGFTCTYDVDASTTGSDGDSYVQFTETVTFDTAAPSGTKLYLTDTASDIDPGADDERKLDFSRGSGSVETSGQDAGTGPLSGTQFTRIGTNVRWYTPQLSATTLTGPILANLRGYRGGGGGLLQNAMVVELIKRTSGGTETTIGKAPWNWGGNIPNTDADGTGMPQQITIGISNTSLSDGDRLGLIVYFDDAAIGNSISGVTISMSYSGTSASAPGDAWIQANSTLTESTPANNPAYRNPMPPLIAQ